jgi:hypothetical protein
MVPRDDWGHICARSRLDPLLSVFVDCVCEVTIFRHRRPTSGQRRSESKSQWPRGRCWTARPDLGERWSSRLVATEAEDRLSVWQNNTTRRCGAERLPKQSRFMSTRPTLTRPPLPWRGPCVSRTCCVRATVGGASPTSTASRRNQAARSRLSDVVHGMGGLGNGPLLLCSLAASRSARCSKDAAPLSRSISSQDRIVARVRRGGHIRPDLAFFRPRCHSRHCRGQRCGRCRGNHQIVPLFRARAAVGSAVAR